MNTLTIVRFTIQEAVKRRLVLAGSLISLIFLGLFALGFAFLYGKAVEQVAARPNADREIEVIFAGTTLTALGLYAVHFLSSFLALFLSVGAISGEIDSGALHAILARPVRRAELVVGRWLGFSGLIAVYVGIMSGVLLLLARLVASYEPTDAVRAVALMMLASVSLLTVSLFGSTLLPTLANGVVVFTLFGLAWLAGIIETAGNVLANAAMVNIGIVVSLLIPNDAIWHGASYYVQSPAFLIATSAGRGTAPFFSTVPPTASFVAWACLYVVAFLLAAIYAFSRRDL